MFRQLPALLAAVAFFTLIGCATGQRAPVSLPRQLAPLTGTARIEIKPFAPAPRAKTTIDKVLPEGHSAARAVEVAGVQLVPIHAANVKADTDYLTLDEALKAGVFTVAELDQGTVNTLSISNTGTKPVFLMAGDLVLGGKQDRIVATSLVVEPKTTDQRLSAFCVEHGRWQAKSGGMKFDNDAAKGQVDIAVKKAAVGAKNQSAVWQAVAANNASLGVRAEGGSFRATYDSEKVAKQLDDAMRTAQPARDGKAVGYAVLMDSEVVAMDLFESSGLCAKLSEKLLRSYLISALSGGYNRPEDHPLVEPLQDKVTVEFVGMPLMQAIAALDEKWRAKLEFKSRYFNPFITFKATDKTIAEVIDTLCIQNALWPNLGTGAEIQCEWRGEESEKLKEKARALLHHARELFDQHRFIAARDFLRRTNAEFAWSAGLSRAADICQDCFDYGMTAQRGGEFVEACATVWNPRRRSSFGTGNDAGFFFEDVVWGQEDNGGGQFDNGSGGIAPMNPMGGIFFNNQDPNNPPVYFSQDIRGRFEHIFDQSLAGYRSGLPILQDQPLLGYLFRRQGAVRTTALGVGTPEPLESEPKQAIEHDCKDEKRNSTVHKGYMRR